MKKEPEYLARNITLKKEHLEWIRKNYINLSRFVRTKIEEEMKKR